MKARRPKKGDNEKEGEDNDDEYIYVCKLADDTSQKKVFKLREENLNREIPASDGIDLVSLKHRQTQCTQFCDSNQTQTTGGVQ